MIVGEELGFGLLEMSWSVVDQHIWAIVDQAYGPSGVTHTSFLSSRPLARGALIVAGATCRAAETSGTP